MGCRGALSLHKKRVFQKLINGTQIARIAQIYHIVIQFIICVIRVICVPFGDLTHLLVAVDPANGLSFFLVNVDISLFFTQFPKPIASNHASDSQDDKRNAEPLPHIEGHALFETDLCLFD